MCVRRDSDGIPRRTALPPRKSVQQNATIAQRTQPGYDHWAVTGRPSAITSRPQPLRWDTSSGKSFADFAVISSTLRERSVHM